MVDHFKLIMIVWLIVGSTIVSAFSPRAMRGGKLSAVRAMESKEDAEALFAQAEALRREAAEAESAIAASAVEPKELRSRRLKLTLPMSKPDWSIVEEDVEFMPFLNDSQILRLDVKVPCGIVLEQQEDDSVAVVEVETESNGERAGVRVGDLLRATSALRAQMEMPTWQLIGGGIGRPRLFRFIFGCDLCGPPRRRFEDVLAAVASNRDDPEGRPALLVLERRFGE